MMITAIDKFFAKESKQIVPGQTAGDTLVRPSYS